LERLNEDFKLESEKRERERERERELAGDSRPN